jgi:hypothetical protein
MVNKEFQVTVRVASFGTYRLVAQGAAVASTPVETLDAGRTHEPGDPLEIDRQLQPERQLGVCQPAGRVPTR